MKKDRAVLSLSSLKLNASASYAFFLDFDGTLIELAPTPESIHVPVALRDQLMNLRTLANGALAIVTGRTIAQIDHYLSIPDLVVAGVHGGQWRDAHQKYHTISFDQSRIAHMHQVLAPIFKENPSWILENKGFALALHYRARPEDEKLVQRIAHQALVIGGEEFVVQAGKMVFEIKPRLMSKGRIIEWLMQQPPFKGHIPIFAGDDVTDESGFEAIHALEGLSIKVGKGRTIAHYRAEDVSHFHQWLLTCLQNI